MGRPGRQPLVVADRDLVADFQIALGLLAIPVDGEAVVERERVVFVVRGNNERLLLGIDRLDLVETQPSHTCVSTATHRAGLTPGLASTAGQA